MEEDELALLTDEARALLREDGPLRGASLRERADLLALVRSGTLTGAEREHLARRLLASRDAGAAPWVIERLVTVAALLDELDFPRRADELRPDAHALLLECWVEDDGLFSRRPGFFARRWQPSDDSFPPHTLDAVDLMLRFGVPEGIDLAGVRLGLQKHLHRLLPWQETTASSWEADLALWKLERGLQPRLGWLARASAHRVLLAMLVLASFCVAASLRARRDPFPPAA